MKPTLENVAKLANTSIATVSRALNDSGYVSDDLKLKVEQAVKQLGYKRKVYKSLPLSTLSKIVVITNDDFSNPNSFYYAVLSGLKFEAERLEIDIEVVLIDSLGENKEALEEQFEGADAVILVGMENPSLLDVLKSLGKPVQIINGSDPSMQFSSISPDYEYGGYLAGQYLLEAGNRNNCIITVNFRQSLIDRQLGFQRAHRQIDIHPERSCKVIDLVEYAKKHDPILHDKIIRGDAGGDFGAKYLLPKIIDDGLLNNIDGVFCICDLMAISLMQTLKSKKMADISIIGFDDLPISSLVTPQLTTIRSNYYDLAKQGLAMLISKQAHSTISGIRSYMAVELIERNSVFPQKHTQ